MLYNFEERFVLELPTSRAMLATARPSCSILRVGGTEPEIHLGVVYLPIATNVLKISLQHQV